MSPREDEKRAAYSKTAEERALESKTGREAQPVETKILSFGDNVEAREGRLREKVLAYFICCREYPPW